MLHLSAFNIIHSLVCNIYKRGRDFALHIYIYALALRPTQTERDYTTRRDFFVFKSKQNRLWKEILQDIHTKWFKLLICFQRFGKREKIWKLNDFENSIFASRYQIAFGLCGPLHIRSTMAICEERRYENKIIHVLLADIRSKIYE